MTIPVYDSVAYLASDRFAVFNAAGDSFASEFAPGARLRADCGTDGVLLGTVTAASFDAATGRTVVTTAMDGGAALTANLAAVLHGNDLPASLCAHAALHALGGRDALPGATTGVSGLVSLASTAETQAGTSATKAVTPAGLAASAKGLIATNTTIYVATTGSDTTGTGASGAPYATIARALSNIAGKLIASGVIVTIQVADGTYAVGSTIVIDHPDADKIQILGNTSAETTAAITAIDTTAKTFTVSGNYVSNADTTKNIVAGDIIGLTGSSTNGLNGAYFVSGVTFNGTNTVITCSAETFASGTIGGGSIIIKPCNKCRLVWPADGGFVANKTPALLSGLTLISGGSTGFGLFCNKAQTATITKCIVSNFLFGVYFSTGSSINTAKCVIKSCDYGIAVLTNSVFTESDSLIIDTCAIGIMAKWASFAQALTNYVIDRACTVPYSPARSTTVAGNYNSMISPE